MYKDDGYLESSYEEFQEGSPLEEIVRKLFIQVHEMETYIKYLHDLIPMKYKKIHPKDGENPFFSKSDFKYTPEEGAAAKLRMEELLRRPEQAPSQSCL